MELYKNWIVTICITLVIGSILSYLSPSNENGRFYKSLIKLFVLLSFVYPMVNSSFDVPNYKFDFDEVIVENKMEQSANLVVKTQIENLLKSKEIYGVIIEIKSHISIENIYVDEITVIVPDEYNCKDVKKLIFDNLSLNAEVIHIG